MIFSNGTQSTFNKAKQLNVPIVSILWIEACKKQLRLVDPAKYKIHNIEQYENPELYKKPKVIISRLKFVSNFSKIRFISLKVKKFFQTESELKIKKRKLTPTLQKFKSIKIPKKAKDNLTGMLNEFRERQANSSSGINYFSENFKVGDMFNDTKATGGRRTESTSSALLSNPEASTSRKGRVSSPLQSSKTDKTSLKSNTKSHVSTALAKLPQTPSVQSPAIFKTPANRKTILASSSNVQPSNNSLVRVTRRTSLLALSSPSLVNTPIQRNLQAEPAQITEITGNVNSTKNISEPMEITPNGLSSPRVISNRRVTNYTSSEMEVTNAQPTEGSKRKRHSIAPMRFKDYEVNTKKYLVKNSTNNSQSDKSIRRKTIAPTSSTKAVSPLNKVNGAQTTHPNLRRTLFAVNQTPSNTIDASTSDKTHEDQVSTYNQSQSVFAPNEASSPLEVVKSVTSICKNLFKTPTATLSPLAVTASTKVDDRLKSNSKRRRTLLPPASPSPLAVATVNKISEKEDSTPNREQSAFTPSHVNPIASTSLSLNKIDGTAKEVNRRRTCFASSHANEHLDTSQGKCKSILHFIFSFDLSRYQMCIN